MARMARSAPIMRSTACTMARENPDSSISLPNTAPNRNTGKYSLAKPAMRSMKMPENTGASADGSVNNTAPMAAMGAHKMTL
ncbi:hypothetical protein D3C77_592210 [compost metagenome]